MTYLVDFDLDGDVCECLVPLATHPPLEPVRSLSDGRPCTRLNPAWHGDGEAPAFVRHNARIVTPRLPSGPPMQINRPPRKRS